MTPMSDPIVIFEDDYEGEYMILPKGSAPQNVSPLMKVLIIVGIVVIAVISFGVMCRIARRLLT